MLFRSDPQILKRSYATTAYYLPNRDRPNYKVAIGVSVSRVLTEKSGNDKYTAVGVEFKDTASGEVYIVNTKKEVIISAGYESSYLYRGDRTLSHLICMAI